MKTNLCKVFFLCTLWTLSALFAQIVPVSLAVANPGGVPPELDRWRDWVLHNKEDYLCPCSYDDGSAHECLWPSVLQLDLGAEGGRFAQEWYVFMKGWIPLPGDADAWPQDVMLDGKNAPLVLREGAPRIYVQSGKHKVEGAFAWKAMPETLQTPSGTGLVNLTMDKRVVDFPVIEAGGRLWLQKRKDALSQEDRMDVNIYRLITDSIPMRVMNLLRVNCSGQMREVKLDGILLEGAVPLSINSPLPARLGTDGSLTIQARPGRFEIFVDTWLRGPIAALGPVSAPYGRETWAFQPRNDLRMVQVEGISATDPGQTDAPPDWKGFSNYIVEPGAKVLLRESRRGDPDPAPDKLGLQRTLWLDFDGKGFTSQDRISGAMSRQWRLAMDPPTVLGRVSVDGVDQLITNQGESPENRKAGIELRKGCLNLAADSRIEGSLRTIPAVGWDHDMQSISAILNLPPGWRLFAASGVDHIQGTWVERWNLLDLFLVLLISIAVMQLWGRAWGLLALLTLTLTYHEPGAPQITWLHLLATTALLRFLPECWARRWVKVWRIGAIAAIVMLAIPFMVNQVRWGVYPQLEPPQSEDYASFFPGSLGVVTQRNSVGYSKYDGKKGSIPSAASRAPAGAPPTIEPRTMVESADSYNANNQKRAALTQDPKARIQTGPGLPSWQWRDLNMSWNGPVARDQQIHLWLIPPAGNMILSFIRVFFLAFLIAGLLGGRLGRFPRFPEGAAALGLALAFAAFTLPAAAAAAESPAGAFPPAELLKEFEQRLLEPPECSPHCAESPRMDIKLSPDALKVLLEVHAAARTAVPLPGNAKAWIPEQLTVDGGPSGGVLKDKNGVLWITIPEGVHRVLLFGKIQAGHAKSGIQIFLPLRPHQVRVENPGESWDVQGVHPDGQVEPSIQLIRKNDDAAVPLHEAGESAISPLLTVERTLMLGLEWQVHTIVRRISPAGDPIAVAIPLIDGESLTTSQIRVEKGRALIHMEPKSEEVAWDSALEKKPVIRLQAPDGNGDAFWTESWILDASPIWHCEVAGIPVTHHQDDAGFWKPTWNPWPGEVLTIAISRPEVIPGESLTIDHAQLTWTPGRRFDNTELSLSLRSSEGGQHRILLPTGASPQVLKINGKDQPISSNGAHGSELAIPLQPGSQHIQIEWRGPAPAGGLLQAPSVDLGHEAVNADIVFAMPQDRWILWTGGPRFGPAVIFWSYLVVVILAGIALGKASFTPLKTHHWILLGLGLTQVHPLVALLIAGWLLALGLRKRKTFPQGWFYFDLTQLALVVWTVMALISLYLAVKEGLLGIPNMQIAGNGSYNLHLHWSQDRIQSLMPRPWAFTVPLLVFRILMLLWALWLAQALLKWLRWGWQCISEGGLWRKRSKPTDAVPEADERRAPDAGSET